MTYLTQEQKKLLKKLFIPGSNASLLKSHMDAVKSILGVGEVPLSLIVPPQKVY
jgi:hypothetical protein